MEKNNKGFIDLLTILIILALSIGVYFCAKNNDWNIDTLQTKITNRINGISYKDKRIGDYLDHYRDLSVNLKDEYLSDIDVPELSEEIKEYLVNHKDEGWKYAQNPEAMVLSDIISRCVKDGEVVPECRKFFNQLSDIVIPVKK